MLRYIWPFVSRKSFNEVMKDNCRLAESEYQLQRKVYKLEQELRKAQKNDHRAPNGQFMKKDK